MWLRRPLPVALWASARLAAAAVTGESEARRALHGLLLRLPAALARRRPLPEHVEHAARLVDSGACASAEARRRS
ncbi:hypothetical protein [Streptomyces durhamensis]|uniref:hypothetical protein n=1 Tax=Streptomyces durhamensis TaxID=68194 RepID=UPI000B0F40A0